MQKYTYYFLWNTTALFLSYMSVVMPLPVISGFVTKTLGFSNSLGGVVIGISFLTTILTRGLSGKFSDRNGGKICMLHGLLLYAVASGICFCAATLLSNPVFAVSLLIIGRLVLGLGESLVLVGMLSWNISLLGPQRSGMVFSLVGASVYGAFAAGGPLGMLCNQQFGFAGLMLLCTPLPLLGWLMIVRMPAALSLISSRPDISFFRVLGLIWRQGTIVGLQGVGFALTCFGIGFVLVRLFCGNFPNKFGGIQVATGSLAVVACGQFLLWLAPSAEIALTGAFLTGTGCSLVYPSMGVEAIQLVQPELRGTAVGAFAIFQDVAYGATAPIAGLFADHFGYSVVFLLGLAAALFALLIGLITMIQRREAAMRI